MCNVCPPTFTDWTFHAAPMWRTRYQTRLQTIAFQKCAYLVRSSMQPTVCTRTDCSMIVNACQVSGYGLPALWKYILQLP